MRRSISTPLLLSLALLTAGTAAQASPSAASRRYHEAREAQSIPPYGLQKVRALIHRLKTDSEGGSRLGQAAYDGLSFNEKFTYVMLHGEDFDQNCDMSPGIMQEERKIFSYVPSAFADVAMWSKRQQAFLKENRTLVIGLMRDTIRRQHRVGANFKQAIVELKAVELIPDLCAVYRSTRRDHDILTVLMILMKDAKYRPFVSTQAYRKLFGDQARYEAFLPATPANQNMVLNMATTFYRSRRS